MEGGNFNSIPNPGESQEFLSDEERKRALGNKIAEIMTHQSMIESLRRRQYVGDSKKSRTAMVRNENQIARENAEIERLRQQAIALGGAAEIQALDRRTAKPAPAETAEPAPAEQKPQPAPEEPTPERTVKPTGDAAELQQPDYEAIVDWNTRETTAVASRGAALDRDLQEALAAANQVTQDEINAMLRDTHNSGEALSPEQALSRLAADIDHLSEEIRQLENRSYFDQAAEERRLRDLEEAGADLVSMRRRQHILEKYHENGDTLPVEAAQQAAGGEIDDLGPGRSAEDEAKARRVIDWAEAEYLDDDSRGSATALRGLYFKELGELTAQGMTKEQADAAISEAHGLSAEDLQRLSSGIETDEDKARVIALGEEALAAARQAAEEARKLESYSAGHERLGELDQELSDELDALNEELSQAIAERRELAEGDPRIAELDQKIEELSRKIQELKDRNKVETLGVRSGMQELGTNVGTFQTIDYEYSKFEHAPISGEQKKQNIFERLRSNGGFKKVFSRATAKAAAAILSVLMLANLGASTGGAEESNKNVYEQTTSVSETGSTIDGGNIVIADQEYVTDAPEVNLTQMQLEAMFGESVRNIKDLDAEYMMQEGYKELPNGVFYNDNEYYGYGEVTDDGQIANKRSAVAFATNHENIWENKDEEETANDIYAEAHANLAALAAYACSFPDILDYCGMPRDTMAPAFYQEMVHGENGAELQEKALQALKAVLESKDTKIEFGTLQGKVRTDYISSPFAIEEGGTQRRTTPLERQIKYNTARRNNAKAFFVTHQAAGSELANGMIITAACMQTNVFLTSPTETPSGKPVNVPVDSSIPEIVTTVEEEDTTTTTTTEEDTTTTTTTEEDDTTTEEEDNNTTTTPENPGTPDTPNNPTNPGTPDVPEEIPNKPNTPDTPDTPDNSVKNKDAGNIISNANIGGTGTITERNDHITQEDVTTENSATPVEGNQEQVIENMVVDSTATAEEQQTAHEEQMAADQQAEEMDNRGPMSDDEFESLMDYFSSVTNGDSNSTETSDSSTTSVEPNSVDNGETNGTANGESTPENNENQQS